MKSLFFTIILLVSINMYAQIESKYGNAFIRVYNIEGKKIAKGKLLLVTEKSITLIKRNKRREIFLKDIGKIRTKRSFGNNVLKGAAIGGGTLAVIGAASAPNDSSFLSFTPLEGAAIGTVVGGFFGAGIGTVTGLFKNSKVYPINGDLTKLESFKNLVLLNKKK